MFDLHSIVQIHSIPCWFSVGVQVRKVNFGRLTRGVLHSKFWIVDRKHVFIGSANMDWRALTQVTAKRQIQVVISAIKF